MLRTSKTNKQGLSPIEVWISCNGERGSFNSGKFAKKEDWNKGKQEIKVKTEEAKLINDYLITLRNKIYEKEIELIQKGYVPTPLLLKEALFNKIEALNEKTLLQLTRQHNVDKKALVGTSVAAATQECFEHSERLFQEYILNRYDRQDVSLKEVNLSFIQGFHTFLLQKGMCQNSCTKHLKFLKKVMNLAVASNYISYNLVNAYKVEREAVEMDFLDEEELRKIINFDTPIPRFEKARDFFLFGCFTGLSYIDIKTLDSKHFETDGEGRIWIKKHRVKTGVLSRVPLLPMAKMILDKYKGGKHLIPIQDPSDINKYLKDIAILCGINKRITFHTSRHTFATTITLSNNISLEVVSKMLGHTNTRMTSHYAKLIDRCIAEQMDTIMDSFNK